jgi:hypothetical protein
MTPLEQFPFQLDIRVYRADADIWGDKISFVVFHKAAPYHMVPEKVSVGRLSMETLEDNGYAPPEPTFTIPRAAGQKLMDELWNMGIRPSDIGTPGHLAATVKHLEDMRAIVGEKLAVKLP